MKSLILSRRDIDFMVYEWLKAEQLCDMPRYADHSRETFDATLDLSEQLATEHFATHNKKMMQMNLGLMVKQFTWPTDRLRKSIPGSNR